MGNIFSISASSAYTPLPSHYGATGQPTNHYAPTPAGAGQNNQWVSRSRQILNSTRNDLREICQFPNPLVFGALAYLTLAMVRNITEKVTGEKAELLDKMVLCLEIAVSVGMCASFIYIAASFRGYHGNSYGYGSTTTDTAYDGGGFYHSHHDGGDHAVDV